MNSAINKTRFKVTLTRANPAHTFSNVGHYGYNALDAASVARVIPIIAKNCERHYPGYTASVEVLA